MATLLPIHYGHDDPLADLQAFPSDVGVTGSVVCPRFQRRDGPAHAGDRMSTFFGRPPCVFVLVDGDRVELTVESGAVRGEVVTSGLGYDAAEQEDEDFAEIEPVYRYLHVMFGCVGSTGRPWVLIDCPAPGARLAVGDSAQLLLVARGAENKDIVDAARDPGTHAWVTVLAVARIGDGIRLLVAGAEAVGNEPMDGRLSTADRTAAFVAKCRADRQVSVRELLANTDLLGLPAFQRGQVWDGAAATGLLRSLSHGYFVGTLLLWAPKDPPSAFSPLRAGTEPRILLLDGQQRVRALLDAFRPAEDRAGLVDHSLMCVYPAQPDGRPGDTPFWRGRRFKGEHAEAGSTVPLPLFRGLIADDAYWTQELVYRYPEDTRGDARTRPRPLQGEAWATDLAKFERPVAALLEAKIAVNIVEFDDAAAMDNYRRLNEGGKGLLAEELAFAELLRHSEARLANEALAASLGRWPEPEASASGSGNDDADDSGELERRDNQLARGDERHFGLKLFVRAVGIAHDLSNPDQKEESGRRFDQRAFGEKPKGRVAQWVKDAGEACVVLADSFTRLKCDTRARIPNRDVSGAWGPLLALLIRFPALRTPTASPHVDLVVLGMFIDKPSPRSFETVVNALSAAEAIQNLRAGIAESIEKGLRKAVMAQQTSYGRYVDLLYWLLRTGNARDVPVPRPSEGKIEELTYKSEATRQHIVPWSRLEGRPKRTAAGWINSIGNLTWISDKANHFLGGWGDTPMQFHGGELHAKEHFADGFEDALRRLRDDPSAKLTPDAPELSELMGMVGTDKGSGRTEALATAFVDWWRDVCDKADESPFTEALEPMPRRPCPLDLLYRWWQDSELARLAVQLIGTPYAPAARPDSGWTKDTGRVRTKRCWGELQPDCQDLRLEVRGVGIANDSTIVTFTRDRITIHPPGVATGCDDPWFSPRSQRAEAMLAIRTLIAKDSW